jgi:hypothetical protein
METARPTTTKTKTKRCMLSNFFISCLCITIDHTDRSHITVVVMHLRIHAHINEKVI